MHDSTYWNHQISCHAAALFARGKSFRVAKPDFDLNEAFESRNALEDNVVDQSGLAYMSGDGDQCAPGNVSNWFKGVVVHNLKIIQPRTGLFCKHLFCGSNQSGRV